MYLATTTPLLFASDEPPPGIASGPNEGAYLLDDLSVGSALIIEDDTLMVAALAAHLDRLSYAPIIVVSNARDAMAAVGRREPDLVLADILLDNGESGIDIARQIHAISMVPFVFVSSRASLAHGQANTTCIDKASLTAASLAAAIGDAKKILFLD